MDDKEMMPSRVFIHGANINVTEPPQDTDGEPLISFEEEATQRRFALDDSSLSSHLLLLGETGSGKTNVLKHIINSLLTGFEEGGHEDDVIFIFDPKEELSHQFFERDNPRHRILSSGYFRKNTLIWNIYDEITPSFYLDLEDGEGKRWHTIGTQTAFELALDVSDHLFADTEATQNPFFPAAARTLFTAKLVYEYQRAKDHKTVEQLDNAHLSGFFREQVSPEAYNRIAAERPELRYIKSLYGYSTNTLGEMGQGVFAVLTEHVNRCLHGDFALKREKNRMFSGREAAVRKGGKVYFLCFDPSDNSSKAIFRLILDSILKVQLSQNLPKRGHVYLVLEEARLVLPLHYLEQALNEGRGLGLRVIGSLQSASQVYSGYDKEKEADAILAGFTNVIALRNSDRKTREFLSDRAGKCYVDYSYETDLPDFYRRPPTYLQREGQVIEDWDILSLRKGQSIVLLNNCSPFKMNFPKYTQTSSDRA